MDSFFETTKELKKVDKVNDIEEGTKVKIHAFEAW